MCLHNVCSSAVPHTISTSTLSAVPAAPDPSSTRSAGPDGPNGTETKSWHLFLKMVLFISWSRAAGCARGLVPRFDFAVSRGAGVVRSDTSPSPTRGVDRPEPARLAISSDLIYSIS